VRGSDRARLLRRENTDAERTLWLHLRGSRLCGYKFRRQCPLGGYIVDFLCVARRLVVEVDGGQHALSEYDRRRTRDLEEAGMIVLRYWNDDVLVRTDAVLEDILTTLNTPHPNPLPAHGERERMAQARAARRVHKS